MASESNSIQVSNTTAGIIIQGGSVNITGDMIVNPASQAESPDFSVPHLIDTFRGRDEDLAKLERLFFVNNVKKVAICGLPGMGKSELAKQFARRCEEKKQVKFIFWINAENKDSLDELSVLLKDLYKKYTNSKCLFLFDNTVNRKAICEVEPLSDNTNHLLLITSQVNDWQDDVESLELEPLNSDLGIDIFRAILGKLFNEQDRELYSEIGNIVSYIPLGLQVTAALVRQCMKRTGQHFDLGKYIKEIKRNQDEYIDEPIPACIKNSYEKSVFRAIQISINYIKSEKNVQFRDLALSALYDCAYLHPDCITLDGLIWIPNIQKQLIQYNKDENMLREALSVINNYSLISFNPNYRGIKIHRLVQEILRRHLRECDPDMQFASYGSCLEVIFNDIGIRDQYYIFKFSDENSVIFDRFYREHKQELVLNQDDGKLKNILESFIRWNCKESLRKILDDILGCTLFNFIRQCMCIRPYTSNYLSNFELVHHAAWYNNVDVLKMLVLDFDFDINSKIDAHNYTPLHKAAWNWNFEAIRFLVEHRADVNAQNRWGEIPLFVFFRCAPRNDQIISDDVKEILGLLNFEQQKHTRYDDGDTLLHVTTFNKHFSFMKLLVLDHHVDIDSLNDRLQTPLHIAAWNGHFDSIQFLIQHNADVNITDDLGQTPLFTFIKFSWNLQHFKLEEVKEILNLFGYKRNDKTIHRSGETLLHAAAEARNADMVTLLATHYELDVNAQTTGNLFTPLHTLVDCAYRSPDDAIRTVQALRRCGARLDIEDWRRRTPRQLAEHEGREYLVSYLAESESLSKSNIASDN